MTVIDIRDYQPKKAVGPVEVTFFGFPFKAENQDRTLSCTITIADGNYLAVIEIFKQNGGVYMPDDDGETQWFLPWPCAAIRLRAVPS
jgi:hypothetical protein